jgi:hypothetical protein
MTEGAQIEASDVPEWGPKMAALNERQRKFVLALFADDCPEEGDGQGIWAAERAGYGNSDGTSTSKVLGVIASRLLASDDVKRAIVEVGSGEYFAILPRKVRAVKHILRNKNHRDYARVAMAGIDRIVPLETTHHLSIEDRRGPSPEAIERVIQKIGQLCERFGLPARGSAPVIEADFHVVGDGA